MDIIIGMDPGTTGAVAVLSYRTSKVVDYPVEALELVKASSEKILSSENKVFACLEAAHGMPGEGANSITAYIRTAGIMEGWLQALNISYEVIAAATWKKALGGLTLPGIGRKQTEGLTKQQVQRLRNERTLKRKTLSLEKARALFPALADRLARKKDHNRAEALLIAEFYRRKITGAGL